MISTLLGIIKKKDDSGNEDAQQEDRLREKQKKQDECAVGCAKRMEEQAAVIDGLERELPPDLKAALSTDIEMAKSALKGNQPVPAGLMAKLNDALKNQEFANMQKAIGGGIVYCAASAASLGTGTWHGLDNLGYARQAGRLAFAGMGA